MSPEPGTGYHRPAGARKAGKTYYSVKMIIAWHLAHDVRPGGKFTIELIETWVKAAMIAQGRGGKRVECDRRLRELQDDGYIYATHASDQSLAMNEYRLLDTGKRLWEQS